MFLIILAVLPSLLIGWFVYKKDKIEKESTKLLFTLFIMGLFSTIPAFFTEKLWHFLFPIMDSSVYSGSLTFLLSAFVVSGLTEEFYKWLVVYFYTWNHKEFNHVYDIVVYSVFVSLGFATLENILYVTQFGLNVAIVRAFLSVPAHVFFAVFMGYYLSLSKQYNIKKEQRKSCAYKALSLVIPIILHGTLNFCLLTGNEPVIIIYLVIILCLYIVSFVRIARLSKVTNLLYNKKVDSDDFEAKK